MAASGTAALNQSIRDAIANWPKLAPFMTPPRTKAEHARLLAALDAVLDAGGADEKHPLARLAEYLGDLVAEYEATRRPIREVSVPDFLRQLMAERGLRQSELPEIGAQSVVSDVLRGKRRLNVRQIAGLSRRFGVPAEAFMP